MEQFEPLRPGLTSLPGFGMQGNNGNMNDLVMQLLENVRSPGAGRTATRPNLGKAMPTTGTSRPLGGSTKRQMIRRTDGGGGGASRPRPTGGGPASTTRRPTGRVTPVEENTKPPLIDEDDDVLEDEDPYSIPGEADEFMRLVYDILMGGAGRADYSSAFNPLREQMSEQVGRGAADVLEQFGNMGAQYGSGSMEGVTEYVRRGEQDINSILGQLEYGADEANRSRMLQGALNLSQQAYGAQEGGANRELQLLMSLLGAQTAGQGQLGQMGMFMQGIDQGALDNAYREWLRQEQGWTDEQLAFLGTPMATSDAYYESGWWDQFAPIFTSILTGGGLGGGA